MITRRSFLKSIGRSTVPLIFTGCTAKHQLLDIAEIVEPDVSQFPAYGLARSAPGEYDFDARVVGKIQKNLHGILYRNGPGLFQRGNLRKRCLIDGDGMIQAFAFSNGKVHFQNRFVRSKKFFDESRAGRFIYPTWSTQAPGGVLSNMFQTDILSQAGITVVAIYGKLYAFDESQKPYEIDPDTLRTLGETTLSMPDDFRFFAAHSKIDGKTGEWLLFGLEQGPRTTLHIFVLSPSGRLANYRTHILPGPVYIHDFFATKNHLIFNLHPVKLNLVDYLFGQKSFLDSMSWHPENGNLILVFDRSGGSNSTPSQAQSDACWMWHSINACEVDDCIVADFIGYQNPDHIIGDKPALVEIMSGRRGNYEFPGEIWRYIIDLKSSRICQEKTVSGSYEFPSINPHHLCHPYRFTYCAFKHQESLFFSGVSMVDLKTFSYQMFDFGRGKFCGEPLFVPQPGFRYDPDLSQEPGWVLVEVYDTRTGHKSLAVFRTESFPDGPTAWVHLDQYLPLGLHGFWKQA